MSFPPIFNTWIDRAVNLSMLWTGSLLTGSGLALKYRVGYDAPRGASVWGMDGERWAQLHWVLALVMLGLLLLHLIRHANWIWNALASRLSPIMGLILLIALLLVFFPLLSP